MDKITVAEARRGRQDRCGCRGWVRTRRDSKGGFSFIELNDGSCQGNVQVVAAGELPNYESEVKHLHTGASVAVEGEVKASPAKGQATEVHASKRRACIGGADAETYPLQKKGHTFEFLRTIAHLRPRTNTFGAIARLRNQVVASRSTTSSRSRASSTSTRRSSPPATARGPGALFRVTTLDPDSPPKAEGKVDFTQGLLRASRRSSPSAASSRSRSFACSLGKVYTFGPTFRAENSNTPRHLAEFWMIEPEMAFYDLTDNMDLAEAFLKRIIARRAGALRRGHEVLRRSASTRTCSTRLENVLNNAVPARAVHRGGRHPAEVGQDVRVPGRVGQRPAERARALS